MSNSETLLMDLDKKKQPEHHTHKPCTDTHKCTHANNLHIIDNFCIDKLHMHPVGLEPADSTST